MTPSFLLIPCKHPSVNKKIFIAHLKLNTYCKSILSINSCLVIPGHLVFRSSLCRKTLLFLSPYFFLSLSIRLATVLNWAFLRSFLPLKHIPIDVLFEPLQCAPIMCSGLPTCRAPSFLMK